MNEGGGMNADTCVFTAPKKGLYHFSMLTLLKDEGSRWCGLADATTMKPFVVNGHNEGRKGGQSFGTNRVLDAGQGIVAMCVGDMYAPEAVQGENDEERLKHFQFSGHLVTPM
jgi:hypothetical protein